jgi:predicted DNA-binding transcriptional regulator YafY
MQTPLWLNLKKEYIDDNFENLLGYLKNSSLKENTDTFYEETVGLLRERVRELVATYSALPIYEDPDSESHHFSIRLLAAYLLMNDGGQLSVSAYLTLMFLLLQHKKECSLQIMKNVSECLRHNSIKSKGFYWNDIIEYSPDIFAHKAIKNVVFGTPLTKSYVYNGFGTAILSAKSLYLFSANAESSRKLLTTGADSLAIDSLVALRTPTAGKLKQSLESNLVEMDKYVTDFCEAQTKTKQAPKNSRLKSYSDGDEANVTVTRVDYFDKIIYVETVDPNYEKLSGRIVFSMPSLMYYYTSTLANYFEVGYVFPTTITNATAGYFNIEKELVTYIVEECRNTTDPDDFIQSLLIDRREGHQYGWITIEGVTLYTDPVEGYEKGDFAWINITEYQEGKRYGRIIGEVGQRITDSIEMFNEQDARRSCIRSFANSAKNNIPKKVVDETESIDSNILAMLIRLMFTYQRGLLKPSDRFRYLMNARAIACLTGDTVSESYIRFASTYLMILVQFTNNADISAMKLTPDEVYKDAASTATRLLIVDILKRCGHDDNTDFLSHTIEEYRESSPTISKLARLVQTINTTSDMLSNSAVNIIRREIIHTLSIETENDTNLEDDSREYIGVESSTQEFKESIVFPPDNHMQASPTTQARNVMRGICAFLNSETGGTLYIGVNDQGYVVGIEDDMQTLRCHTIDSYIRYVQDKAIELLGVDAASYLNIVPMYDNRCLSIQVKSHPHIVEMEKKAYMRINNETRVMPESTRENQVERKYHDTRGTAQSLFLLYQAKTRQLKVILHNYFSSSSMTTTDREVEIYDIRQEDSLVIGYDLDRKAVRIFKINRIGYVEVTEEPWRNVSHHVKIDIDDFHLTGPKAIPVSLQLDIISYNLLREEFPSSKCHITQDKKDESRWFYNAEVYNMIGLGRFYIGLANHITILKAPELTAYVEEYKKRYL